jgi:predicted RNA binding protein YcfA (HicA-like mRNA interferase family)
VSRKLPAVTGRQVIGALEREGWRVKRIKGSHHFMTHPDLRDAVPVPVHGSKTLGAGLLLNILKTAGISREKFLELLK